jgi:hypothetical protein
LAALLRVADSVYKRNNHKKKRSGLQVKIDGLTKSRFSKINSTFGFPAEEVSRAGGLRRVMAHPRFNPE